MQTNTIEIRNLEVGRAQALEESEKYSAYMGHDPKTALRTRLLVEETIGMISAITEKFWADFWMEGKKDGTCLIHLVVRTNMDGEKKRELIDAAKSKKNEAYKGLTGKIREFLDKSFDLAYADGAYDTTGCFMLGLIDGPMSPGAPIMMEPVTWSMDVYREGIENAKEKDGEAQEAWDELEKSILANLADDVRVSIKGNVAEVVVEKRG
ncbi:MAG: hypothetical protein J6Q02_00340 [Lachnospiraceae bacterium]|nr:hypothetical protein [Lachnospiraceae bacterium]